jgi:hypothetical protein
MPQNFLFPQRDQPLLLPVDARQLSAGLQVDVFDGFDGGLLHVLTQLGVPAAQEPRTRT